MDNFFSKFIKSYERSLLVYTFALSMIIALISTSFIIERRMLRSQKKFASIINISGRQRMLSQKLMVMALQTNLQKNENDMKNLQSQIKGSLTDLRRYYLSFSEVGMNELNSAKTLQLTKSAKDIINDFFNAVDLLTTQAAFNDNLRNEVLIKIRNLSEGPILKLFDDLTNERVLKANRILEDYIQVKYFLYLCTIILILAEGLLIFYPMARKNLKNSLEIIDLHREEVKLKKFSELGVVFSSTIHEINNPLTVAVVKVSSLLKQETIDQPLKETLLLIERNLKRITKIIKSTKAIYRQSDNDVITPVPLSRVTKEAIEAASIIRNTDSIEITVIELQDIVVNAREHQVFQVFLNLIINAVDALKETDKSDKKINIVLIQEEQFSLFRIFDNGPGIDKSDEEKIFQSLYTTKTHGTGMGLTECKRIIEIYGGSIRLNHARGPSCFEVSFPRS